MAGGHQVTEMRCHLVSVLVDDAGRVRWDDDVVAHGEVVVTVPAGRRVRRLVDTANKSTLLNG